MLKLIKYELLKTRTILTIALISIVSINMILFLGLMLKIDFLIGIGGLLTALSAFGIFIGFLIYSAMLYMMDVSKKQGYMLFMTPNSMEKIFASKIITSVIVGVLTIILVLLLAAADFQATIFYARDAAEGIISWGELLSDIGEVLKENAVSILLFITTVFLQWVCIISIIYFAVTVTYTFLSGAKGKGFLIFLIFVLMYGASSLVNLLAQKITGTKLGGVAFNTEALVGNPSASLSDTLSVFFDLKTFAVIAGMYLIFIIASYMGTSYMAKKKLSI